MYDIRYSQKILLVNDNIYRNILEEQVTECKLDMVDLWAKRLERMEIVCIYSL